MDISKLGHQHDFGWESKNLGNILVGTLTVGKFNEFKEKFKVRDISKLDEYAIANKLCSILCMKKNGEDLSPFSEEDIAELDDDELNDFALKFIDKNDWLFDDWSTTHVKTTKNDTERVLEFTEPNKIDLPQNESESGTQYLRRVLSEYIDRENKHFEDHFKGFAQISTKAHDLLKTNRALASNILNSVEGLASTVDRVKPVEIMPIRPELTEYDLSPHPAHETNKQLTVINKKLTQTVSALSDTSSMIRESATIVGQVATLIDNINVIGIEMVEKFTESSQRNTRFNKIMIAIAVLAIFISSVISIYSNISSRKDSANFEKALSNVSNLHENVNNSLGNISNFREDIKMQIDSVNDKLDDKLNEFNMKQNDIFNELSIIQHNQSFLGNGTANKISDISKGND